MNGGLILLLALSAAASALAALSLPGPGSPPAKDRLSVRLKTLHAGRSLSTVLLWLALTGLVITFLAGLALEDAISGLILGLIGAPVALWYVLRHQLARYRAGFRRQFLPAIEIIVRGLRSGMPLLPALQVVQKEVGGPVRIEFRRLLDDLALGLPLAQAVDRMADRIPTTEVQFFAAVIGLQARTGGRLSEALENLAGTLRARDQLDQRIRTVSQEARTSALIIAVLPLLVMLGLFLLNPDYIAQLFIHPLGQAVLVGSALWMGCGAWIMKRMTVIDV